MLFSQKTTWQILVLNSKSRRYTIIIFIILHRKNTLAHLGVVNITTVRHHIMFGDEVMKLFRRLFAYPLVKKVSVGKSLHSCTRGL